MCIAAYLAIGGGLGVSLSTAAHLRTALLWLCWGALFLLTVRRVMRFAASLRFRRAGRRDQPATALSTRRNTRQPPTRTAAA
jgi:predicted signal transduction protein with EAL and GGDEF domain